MTHDYVIARHQHITPRPAHTFTNRIPAARLPIIIFACCHEERLVVAIAARILEIEKVGSFIEATVV